LSNPLGIVHLNAKDGDEHDEPEAFYKPNIHLLMRGKNRRARKGGFNRSKRSNIQNSGLKFTGLKFRERL